MAPRATRGEVAEARLGAGRVAIWPVSRSSIRKPKVRGVGSRSVNEDWRDGFGKVPAAPPSAKRGARLREPRDAGRVFLVTLCMSSTRPYLYLQLVWHSIRRNSEIR